MSKNMRIVQANLQRSKVFKEFNITLIREPGVSGEKFELGGDPEYELIFFNNIYY